MMGGYGPPEKYIVPIEVGRLQATAALIWLAISGSTCLLVFCAISVAHGSVVGPAIGGGMHGVI